MAKKSRQKFKILRTKRAFQMKQKMFFIIFKGPSFKQIIFFLEDESPTLSNSMKYFTKPPSKTDLVFSSYYHPKFDMVK